MASLNQELIFRLTSDGKIDDENNVTIDCKCTGEKIVRCRNCQHYEEFTLFGRTAYICNRDTNSVSAEPNGYCNFGIEEDK